MSGIEEVTYRFAFGARQTIERVPARGGKNCQPDFPDRATDGAGDPV